MSRNNRADRLRKAGPDYDPADPPVGVRLNLGSVAARLGVTISEMAQATLATEAPISRTAVADLLTNKWPVRTDCAVLRSTLLGLMEQRGATDDELLTLFHAHGRTRVAEDGSHLPRGLDASASTRVPVVRPAYMPPSPAAGHAPGDDRPSQEPDMLLPKQSLKPETRRHFKLFTNPFDGEVTSDEQMFIGADLAYVREALRQCAKNGGFVALVGESGAGKTTLVQDLEAWLERNDRSVTVIRPSVLGMEGNDTKGKAIKSADILHAVITQLDSKAVVPQTLQARTVKAGKLLTASAQAGNQHLLVVEEAHSMPDATLKHLKRLHEMRLGRQPLLGILLVAQPELKRSLADGLANGSLREVAQRCEIVELLPLDADLKPYLERRAAAAGLKLATLMDDKAVEQVRARLTFRTERGGKKVAISMCYPLVVNNLVTKALNDAAAIGVPVVTEDVVRAL